MTSTDNYFNNITQTVIGGGGGDYGTGATTNTTVTTNQSLFSRLGNSCKGIVVGIVIGFIGIGLLIWNEGNYVHQQKALAEGLANVIEVPITTSYNNEINPNNEGKLIHVIGMMESNNNIDVADVDFGIHLMNTTIKLYRTVEMYQWIEQEHRREEKNTGGSTTTTYTYTYEKQWRNTLINSQQFHDTFNHQNPSSMKYISKEFISSNITLGPYSISNSPTVMNKITWYEPLDKNNNYDLSIKNVPSTNPYKNQIQSIPNGYYIGQAINRPQIGDTKITYQQIPNQIISIIGKQTYGTFTSYIAKVGGSSFLLIEPGIHDSAEMFLHANQELYTFTWIIRFVGFIFIFVMFQSIMEPLIVVTDIIPCIGSCFEGITSTINALLAFIVSSIIIAVAWLVYRPIVSLCLFGVASIIAYIIYTLRSKKTSNYYEPVGFNDYDNNNNNNSNYHVPEAYVVDINEQPVVIADAVLMPDEEPYQNPEYVQSTNKKNMVQPTAPPGDDYFT